MTPQRPVPAGRQGADATGSCRTTRRWSHGRDLDRRRQRRRGQHVAGLRRRHAAAGDRRPTRARASTTTRPPPGCPRATDPDGQWWQVALRRHRRAPGHGSARCPVGSRPAAADLRRGQVTRVVRAPRPRCVGDVSVAGAWCPLPARACASAPTSACRLVRDRRGAHPRSAPAALPPATDAAAQAPGRLRVAHPRPRAGRLRPGRGRVPLRRRAALAAARTETPSPAPSPRTPATTCTRPPRCAATRRRWRALQRGTGIRVSATGGPGDGTGRRP